MVNIGGLIHGPALLSQVDFKIPPRSTRSQISFVLLIHGTSYGRQCTRHQPIDRICPIRLPICVHIQGN